LFETEEPDHIEDVTGHDDAKVAALLAHESQFETTMYITDHPGSQAAVFRTRIESELETFGRLAGVHHAEAFKHIDAR
jgi:LmbE family N-acetylglucosaminyl deacetylase